MPLEDENTWKEAGEVPRGSFNRGSTRMSSDHSPLAGLGNDDATAEALHNDLSALHGILANDHERRQTTRNSNFTGLPSQTTKNGVKVTAMRAALPENLFDKTYVWLENMTSADRTFPLMVLLFYFFFIVVLFSILWYCMHHFYALRGRKRGGVDVD